MSDPIDLGLRLTGEDDGFSSALANADDLAGQLSQRFDTLRNASTGLGDSAKTIVDGYGQAKGVLEAFGVGVDSIEQAITGSAAAQELMNAASDAGSSILAALGVNANGYSEILDGAKGLQEEFGSALTDGAKGATDYGIQLTQMAASMRFTGIASEFASGMVGKLKLAFLGLFAIFAAINIAKTIYEESESVQLVVNRIVGMFRIGWSYIQQANEMLAAVIETKFKGVVQVLYPIFASFAERIGAVFSIIPGLEGVGDKLNAFAADLRKRLENTQTYEERVTAITATYEADRAKINANTAEKANAIHEAFAKKRVDTEQAATEKITAAGKQALVEFTQLMNQIAAARAAAFGASADADAAILRDSLSRQQTEWQRALQLRLTDERTAISQISALREQAAEAELAAIRVRAEEARRLDAKYEGALGAAQARGDEKEALKIQQQQWQLAAQREQLRAREIIAERTLLDIGKQRTFEFEKLNVAAEQQLAAFEVFAREQQKDLEARLRGLDLEAQLRGKSALEQRIATENARLDVEYQRQRLALLAQIAEVSKRFAEGEEPASVVRNMLNKLAEFDANWAALRTRTKQGLIDGAAFDQVRQFGDDLTSSIVQGFEQGKSASEVFRSFLKSQFSKLILTPSIKFLVDGVLGGGSGGSGGLGGLLGSLLGLGGGSSGGGSSGGGILGGLSSLLGLGGSGGFMGSLGGLIAGGAESGFMAGLGSFVANIGSTGLSGAIGSAFSTGFANFAAGGLGGLMTGLGAILGPLAIIVGALAAFGVFDNEKGFKFDNAADAGGSRRTQLISSPFGNYDFAGDFDNKIVQPLIDSVAKMDTAIVDKFLKRPEDLAAARSRVQGIADPKWFGANDEKEIGESLKAASLQFLQTRYAAIFATIDAKISATIKNFTGSADELVQYIGGVIQLSDAFDSIIEMVPQLEISLGDFVNASEGARNTLGTLAATLKLTTMDVAAAADATIAAAARTPSQAIALVGAKVAELAKSFDGSLASAQALASAEQQRLQMLHDLLVQIAQFGNEISAMFAASADGFRLATMSSEEQYSFFDQKAAALFAELQTATDPQRIRELAANYNAVLQSAFGLLDASQKKDVGEEYAKLAEAANAIAQKQLEAARQKEIDNAQALGKEIGIAVVQAMEKVAATMQTSADVIAAAADKIDNTFTKGITVTGYIDVSDGQTIVLDRQAGAF